MRIVYATVEYPPGFGGGIGAYVAAIAPALAARGHDVTVVSATPEPFPSRERRDGVTVVRLPMRPENGANALAQLQVWQERAEAVAELLERMQRVRPIDLIEFPDYRGEGAAWLAGRERRADPREPMSVVRLHTPLCVLNRYNPSRPRSRALEEFENDALRLADRLVSPSQALVREVRELLPEIAGEIAVDPHPVDPWFLEQPITTVTSASDVAADLDVLYIGRLEERKGVRTLVTAFAHSAGAFRAARLVLVGADTPIGPGSPSMRAELTALLPTQYRDRLEFLGRAERPLIWERLQRAAVVVIPSHFENFPNTCLEAMAAARFVIGTSGTGTAEIIGKHGIVVPPADGPALSRALVQALALSHKQRANVGADARESIVQRFRPEICAEATAQRYVQWVRWPASPKRHPVAERSAAVAVVVPCFNHGAFLKETLASVKAQTCREVECVVVDDGSSDAATLRVLDEIERQGMRVIRQRNQGVAAARNHGVRATDAAFFVPLDADDRIEPTFIERLLPPLLADESLGYAYCDVRYFGTAAGEWTTPEYDPARLLVENLSAVTAVVRREAFELAGGYTDAHDFEDWDFWIALLAVGYRGVRVGEPLFAYRKHAGASRLANTQQKRAETVRRLVERHRRLFAGVLDASLAEKDRQLDAARGELAELRAAIGRAAVTGGSPESQPATNVRMAEAELEAIESSRLWRFVQRLTGAASPTAADPRQRLAEIKSNGLYRAALALKRNPLYRWYARRRYGPDWDRGAALENRGHAG